MRFSPVSADLIIEARQMGGNIAISFATIVVDGNGPVDATVCARLRLSFALALELRNVLDGVKYDKAPAYRSRDVRGGYRNNAFGSAPTLFVHKA